MMETEEWADTMNQAFMTSLPEEAVTPRGYEGAGSGDGTVHPISSIVTPVLDGHDEL